jgi:hypothetical protein
LADLTVPAEALEAFGFHVVGEPFCAADFCFGHGGWMCGLMVVMCGVWL